MICYFVDWILKFKEGMFVLIWFFVNSNFYGYRLLLILWVGYVMSGYVYMYDLLLNKNYLIFNKSRFLNIGILLRWVLNF